MPFELTDGKVVPWWVWMANDGQLADISQTGVREVFLIAEGGYRHVIVKGECSFTKITRISGQSSMRMSTSD